MAHPADKSNSDVLIYQNWFWLRRVFQQVPVISQVFQLPKFRLSGSTPVSPRNYVDKTPLEYMQIRFRRGFDEETPIAAKLQWFQGSNVS